MTVREVLHRVADAAQRAECGYIEDGEGNLSTAPDTGDVLGALVVTCVLDATSARADDEVTAEALERVATFLEGNLTQLEDAVDCARRLSADDVTVDKALAEFFGKSS